MARWVLQFLGGWTGEEPERSEARLVAQVRQIARGGDSRLSRKGMQGAFDKATKPSLCPELPWVARGPVE